MQKSYRKIPETYIFILFYKEGKNYFKNPRHSVVTTNLIFDSETTGIVIRLQRLVDKNKIS